MQLSIAVPSFAFFTYIFMIPSSPLWLIVVKHNLSTALQTLSLFGKFSGKELSTNQLKQHIQNLHASSLSFVYQVPPTSSLQQVPSHQTILVQPQLTKPGPVLRWYLLTHFYLFFVMSLINSELTEQQSLILHHNPQVNTVFNSLLHLGTIILTFQLSSWYIDHSIEPLINLIKYFSLGSRIVQSLLFTMNGFLIASSIMLKEYLKSKSNLGNTLLLFLIIIIIIKKLTLIIGILRKLLTFKLFHQTLEILYWTIVSFYFLLS